MSEKKILCRDCMHWFDIEMAGEECPICWLSGREINTLPTNPDDPDEWELDRFGHAIEPKAGDAS